MSPQDEAELIRIYRESIRPLYSYVSRRVGGDRALAEDLVQETWIRALDAWPSRGVPDEPTAWLIRVARNTLVSHFRRVRPEAHSVDAAAVDLEAEAFTPDSPGAAAIVSWGLSQLRRAHSDLLEAFYFDGKSTREIALERATSERAIEGRLRRAREKLKKQLKRIARPPAVSARRAVSGGTEHA